MKYYRITAKSKVLCNEIDEDAFIVDFKDLLKNTVYQACILIYSNMITYNRLKE